MKATLISHTPDPERVVATAARLCYSAEDVEKILNSFTPEEIEKFIEKLVQMGHQSPIEHVTFTFAIEGVSRALSHQLVRHRIASYSQKSQRYVNESGFDYIVPPSIASNLVAITKYTETMAQIQRAYEELAELVPKEDARYVLPNSCQTSLIATFNARSLHNFFRLRCCTRAQWEIRKLAHLMRKEVRKIAPRLFAFAGPSCETEGVCHEGEMSCNRKHIYFYSNNQYALLSNFYVSFFSLDGRNWPSVEHYYQAQKTTDWREREKILGAETPKIARTLGRTVQLRPDWEEIKKDVMKKALLAKFSQNPNLKAKLLATGEAILHEDSPHDMYWGVRGKDQLGKLLMEVRETLREEG